LDTRRLRLRKPEIGDVDNLFALSSKPEVNAFNPAGPMQKRSEAIDMVNEWIEQDWNAKGIGYHVIFDAVTDAFIGCAGLSYRTLNGKPIANLAYRIEPVFQHRGLVKEACSAILAAYDRRLPVMVLTLETNLPSRAVANSLGFVHDPRFDGFGASCESHGGYSQDADIRHVYYFDVPADAYVQNEAPAAFIDISTLPRDEYAFPGPMRDKLVAAILDGSKTTTSELLEEYDENEPLIPVGTLMAVPDSQDHVVAVIRYDDVHVTRLADVTLEHARGEGEGYESVTQWRTAHEDFWMSPQLQSELGVPDFTLNDDTKVVCERFTLVQRL
jgi:uncharacterized protein YhfF/RimJ/RimL family protein N-acetyltransferase